MRQRSSTTPIVYSRDPIQRAEYLLTLQGFDIGEQRSNDVPPELLEEVFELNMLLEETPSRRRARPLLGRSSSA